MFARLRGLCGLAIALALVMGALGEVRGSEFDELVKLQKQERALEAAGKYREAIPLAQQLVARAEKEFQDRPALVANCLTDLANLYWNQGRYPEAESLHERALKIKETALGPDHPNVANSLNNLAVMYVDQGRYAIAEPLYWRSLKIREKALGPDHPRVAATLNNLGNFYADQARYADAEPLYQRALKITEKALGPDHPDVADTLNNLAVLYGDRGRYAEAEPLCQRALKIREKVLGPNHPVVAASLNNLALLYWNRGRYADAEPLYQRSLKIQEKVLGLNHPDVAKSLNNLAMLYFDEGPYADADPLYQRALKITEKALGPDHPDVATSLNNLANLYMKQGRYADAESLYQRALKIKERAFGPDHPNETDTLNNLANLYVAQVRYADAEPLYQRALKIREKALGPDHTNVASTLNNMASLYVNQGRYTEAEPLIDRALTIWDQAGVAPGERFKAYSVRSQVAWGLNKRPQAVRDLEQALTLAEKQRAHASGGEQERAQLFGTFSSGYERMVAWQQELNRPVEALAAIERSRARSLVDQLAAANVDLLAGVPEREANSFRQREARAKTYLAQLEKQADRTRLDAALEQKLTAAREELVQAYTAIRNASPAYRQLVGKNYRPAALDEIQSKLAGGDGLLLEYLLGDKAGYVVVVPPSGEKARVVSLTLDQEQAHLLGVEAGQLTARRMGQILANKAGSGVLQQLRSASQVEATTERLAVLWAVLVPEAERKLLTAGKLKRWIVVPDATLAAFPFETLVVQPGSNPQYLLDVAPPLINTPSATLLLNLSRQHGAGGKSVLSVGDAVYGNPTPAKNSADSRSVPAALTPGARYGSLRGDLKPLPFTGLESQWVADVFKQQGVPVGRLEKQSAREASVRMYGPGSGVLHLACHGLVDQSYGNLFGALALTPGPQGADDPADDGFLTLAEIYGLNLKGTQLAILSACDTNYGPQQRGEGAWSLSRGFLVAGAKRVVASNWLVDDEAAASLISVYCSSLAKGEKAGSVDYAASLQAAKRWVRNQDKWKSPYYWGTFVHIGPQ